MNRIQSAASTPENTNYIASFPENLHILKHLFSYLNAKELTTCLLVSKQWNQHANNEALWNDLVPEMAFGPKKWNTYFGDIGIAPPFPRVIHQILNAPCPIQPGKKVYETHLLTLIPATVNGQPFTLNSLNGLIQKPLGGGKATKYRIYWDPIQREYGNTAPAASYWTLITKDVIPESRSKKFDPQKQLLATCSQKSRPLYEVPHLLEFIAGILIEHVQNGTRLYSDSPSTYTSCQEQLSSYPDWPVVVGGFATGGLLVSSHYDEGHEDLGVGGCLRF